MADFQFNPDNVLAPVRRTNKRAQCHDLQGALAYLSERISEMLIDEDYSAWIQEGEGVALVEVNLHGMPLYWKTFDATDRPDIVIRNPDMSERETRKAKFGGTMYKVENRAEGVQLLELLASGKNEALNKVLSDACEALKEVDTIELPHIEQRAEILYDEAGLTAQMGKFGEPNEENKSTGRMRISKEKTNKMNQYKQTARRQLGYARLRQDEKKK